MGFSRRTDLAEEADSLESVNCVLMKSSIVHLQMFLHLS